MSKQALVISQIILAIILLGCKNDDDRPIDHVDSGQFAAEINGVDWHAPLISIGIPDLINESIQIQCRDSLGAEGSTQINKYAFTIFDIKANVEKDQSIQWPAHTIWLTHFENDTDQIEYWNSDPITLSFDEVDVIPGKSIKLSVSNIHTIFYCTDSSKSLEVNFSFDLSASYSPRN